ncbi:MAG: multicopper oxidase domain-containing protein [Myxococcales bacterium]|nr:multicopper oxidase domain-containing protein [Myxococcales bacterium]
MKPTRVIFMLLVGGAPWIGCTGHDDAIHPEPHDAHAEEASDTSHSGDAHADELVLTEAEIRFGCLPMGTGEAAHVMCNHGHSLSFRSENLYERYEYLTTLGRTDLTEANLMMGTGAMAGMDGESMLPDPLTPLLEAKLGERVRIRLLSYGPEMHDFHVHGHVWKEGTIWKDTEPLMPAQVYDGVEFHAGAGADDPTPRSGPGDWMYHCHVEPHIASGMWGLFRVHETGDDGGLVQGRYADELPPPVGGPDQTVDVWLVAAEVPVGVTREFIPGMDGLITVERKARIYVPLPDEAAFTAATAQSIRERVDPEQVQPAALVVRLGTRMRIHFRNVMAEAPATLHPHGVAYAVDHDGTMPDDVAWPGGAPLLQEWLADTPGTWPLHDHARTLENLSRGLFGAIVVKTPEEEARVNRDYLLVFHDFDMSWFMGYEGAPIAGGGH